MRRLITYFVAAIWLTGSSGRAMTYTSSVLYPVAAGFGTVYADAAAAGQTVGNGSQTGIGEHALLWTGPYGTVVDLNPAGYDGTVASATNGVEQVGWGELIDANFATHALLWSGSAESVVDLNPDAADFSMAQGVGGDQQVGVADPGGALHAMLWTGSAASAVDLNPINLPGFDSEASATDGKHQVGDGFSSETGYNNHALLWSGSAESAVDLNPTNIVGIIASEALGVGGGQQVGDGYGPATGTNNTPDGYNSHALLWSGSADSAVDLNPATFIRSFAVSTNGAEQAGYALDATGTSDAFAWFGNAASAFDLQSVLPLNGNWSDSHAVNIDAAGNVYGWADGTFDGFTGAFAIEWSSLPEPALMSVLIMPGFFMRRRR